MLSTLSKITRTAAVALQCGLVVFAGNTLAQETTLRMVSAYPENYIYTTHLMPWIKKFNDEGKGILQIDFIGGPKAIPTFEIGNAIRTGVVDMAASNSGYYVSIMPEAEVTKLTQSSAAQMRKDGTFAYMNRIWNEKANMVYLARHLEYTPFHIYLNKKIDKLSDLKGLKIRAHAPLRDFVQALGATPVNIAPGEVYTAMDRGVIDGYAWPIAGIFDMNLQEKTKFRIDPSIYDAESSILVNLDSWKKLSQVQRDFLQKQALNLEAQNDSWKAYNEEEKKKQAKAGIKVIQFSPAEAKQYRDLAYEVGWAKLIKVSPTEGPKLRQLMSR